MPYDIFQRYSPSSPETSSCEDGEYSGDDVDEKSFLVDIEKRNLIENIIMFYKEHTVLWDTTHSDHGHIVRHHEAYKDIAKRINEQMSTNFKWQNIKAEIDKLGAKFRQEYKQSTKNLDKDNGNDDCDEFVPKVSWFYEQLNFLKDHIGCNRKGGKRMDSNVRIMPLSENQTSTANNSCENCKTLSRKIDNLQESINNLCKTVKQNNESIMSAINVRQQASVGAATNEFPITSEQMLQNMEEKISPDNRDIYVSSMNLLWRNCVGKNLDSILDPKIVMAFNIDGSHGKLCLKKYTKFYQALIDSIKTLSSLGQKDPEQVLRQAMQLSKKKQFRQNNKKTDYVAKENTQKIN